MRRQGLRSIQSSLRRALEPIKIQRRASNVVVVSKTWIKPERIIGSLEPTRESTSAVPASSQPNRQSILSDPALGDMEAELLAPYAYTCASPGKGVRLKFIQALNEWFDVSPEVIVSVGDIVQGLHDASLMVDDIEDNSTMRRGRPSAHMVYGLPRTLNTANHVYFLALQEVLRLNNTAATQVFTDSLIELHQGQGKDIYWSETNICPTLEEYEQMVVEKTGGLFRWQSPGLEMR